MNDIALLLKAAAFAAHKHRDQRRKDVKATPYINHPLALAEALCNLRDMLARPPVKWSERRKHEYFSWARAVVGEVRGANPRLTERFDAVWVAGRGAT